MSGGAGGQAVVVGGSRGSGRAVVARLAANGYDVTVLSRTPENGAARHVSVDVAEPERLREALAAAVSQGGPVSVLVFLQRFRGDGDAWEGELAVSLTATKVAIESLRGSFAPAASIVVISSNASHLVAVEQPVGYHVAKAALRQLVRYYAVVLGPEGVRVNCVTPGVVVKPGREPSEQELALSAAVAPLGRAGTPEDVADAVSLLCDRRAAFVTGQDLVADGGLSLLWQETLAHQVAEMDVR